MRFPSTATVHEFYEADHPSDRRRVLAETFIRSNDSGAKQSTFILYCEELPLMDDLASNPLFILALLDPPPPDCAINAVRSAYYTVFGGNPSCR